MGVAAYVAEVRVSDHVARLDDLREVDVGKGEPTSDKEENPQDRCTLPSVQLRKVTRWVRTEPDQLEEHD